MKDKLFKDTCQLRKPYHVAAFSLVEMLMALLVASLLMVSLAPVMTRKFEERITIGGPQYTHEVAFGSAECPEGAEPKKYDDGTEYCEGEFVVPTGVNGTMQITLVGAGGGGAAAATAGIWERTTSGNEDFTVPKLANELEVTIVGGGAGGGPGGKDIVDVPFLQEGEHSWTPVDIALNKYVLVFGCGAGGGSAGSRNGNTAGGYLSNGGGGGSGAYGSKAVYVSDNDEWKMYIGGGGGGGAHYSCVGGKNGGYYGGGGGGGGYNYSGDGKGGKAGTETGGLGGTCDKDWWYNTAPASEKVLSKGESATPGGGGSGGKATDLPEEYEYIINYTYPAGGSGGLIAGGGGGGGVMGTSAGGGGGGATRLIVDGATYTWPGGGGGSGAVHCDAGGPSATYSACYIGGGGGGGGGKGGGDGADVQYSWWKLGSKYGAPGFGGSTEEFPYHADGNGRNGGQISGTVFDSSKNCSGGTAPYFQLKTGENGLPGAITIRYLIPGPGGSGGGGASMAPVRPLAVQPGEVYQARVAQGSSGRPAPYIRSSGEMYNPGDGYPDGNYNFYTTTFYKGENIILRTDWGGGNCGATPGCPSGIAGRSDWYCAISGQITTGGPDEAHFKGAAIAGFGNETGWAADDKNEYGIIVRRDNGTTGGRGGSTTLFGKKFCEPGYGGKASYRDESGSNAERPLKGGDATGYGGCGGGGGYGLQYGGNGAPGYARISWNKTYKRGSEDEYEYSNGGGGGGGSPGNVFRYSIKVKEGDVLKYKLGKGGMGGHWTYVEKTIDGEQKTVLEAVEPQKGGMSELITANNETLRAGGGLGGALPLLNTITVANNASAVYNKDNIAPGKGGLTPDLCEYISASNVTESFVGKDKYCSNKRGNDGTATTGGKGGDTGFGAGTGGLPGVSGGKTGANGSPGVDAGGGGGGAGLCDLGTVSATDALSNPSVGGNGGNGKIIFRWK